MGALKVWDGSVWQIVSQQGLGVPVGGTINALLAKQSAADGDAAWTTAPIVTSITIADAGNVSMGTTTGTKFGTSTTQKQGWWNATPVVQNTGWAITAGYTSDKAFNPESTTVTELARALGTLIDTLKSYGLLGP
jgi:hypothetical protein